MKIYILIFSIITTTCGAVKAQKVDFSIGGDFVSSYVWRGAYSAGASIQPAMGLKAYGFSLTAWGSTDIYGGGFKEFDLTAAYSIAGLSVSVTDYWWAGEGAYKYFMYDSRRTAHHFEGSVSYVLPLEKFPLGLSWNTMFAGEDYYTSDGKRAYSSYFAVSYPFQIKTVDLEGSVGLTPWEGLYASDFAVVSIGLKAGKSLKLTDKFSLPVFGQILTNPRSEDVFFVLGISI